MTRSDPYTSCFVISAIAFSVAVTANALADPEACCLPDGSCADLEPSTCEDRGGVPQGPFTECATTVCPQVPEACCLPGDICTDLEATPCLLRSGLPRGLATTCQSTPCYWRKWGQVPTSTPDWPDWLYAWHNQSVYGSRRIAADDWLCDGPATVTAIHWWGSYYEWADLPVAPPGAPGWFHVAIWTNIPQDANNPWSRPGKVVREWVVPRAQLNERRVALNFYPCADISDETCFQYDLYLPESQWFQQPNPREYFWLSVSGVYRCGCSADRDGDGDVDAEDEAAFNLCVAQGGGQGCEWADLNCDGKVNESDRPVFNCQRSRGLPDPRCCPKPSHQLHPWSWTTRRQVRSASSVLIEDPAEPILASEWGGGRPAENFDDYPACQTLVPWDLAFVLTTRTAPTATDYGDAAPPYPVLKANNGAWHVIRDSVRLGLLLDGENDGWPDPNALGDDHNGLDDEDGVVFSSNFLIGRSTRLTIDASVAGYLSAWVDLNRDGYWSGLNDRVLSARPLAAGVNVIDVRLPSDAQYGPTMARFRFTTANTVLTFTGSAPDGEVEDYRVCLEPPVCRADCDCDGRINFNDINPFVVALVDPAEWQRRYPCCPTANPDCDGDGSINFNDINPFVRRIGQDCE